MACDENIASTAILQGVSIDPDLVPDRAPAGISKTQHRKRRFRVAITVCCPVCAAPVGHGCLNPSGRPHTAKIHHAARWRIAIGAPLLPSDLANERLAEPEVSIAKGLVVGLDATIQRVCLSHWYEIGWLSGGQLEFMLLDLGLEAA